MLRRFVSSLIDQRVSARVCVRMLESFDKNECLRMRIRKSRMRLDKWAFYWSADLFNQDLVEESFSHQNTPIACFIFFYWFDHRFGCYFEWFSATFRTFEIWYIRTVWNEKKEHRTKCDALSEVVFFPTIFATPNDRLNIFIHSTFVTARDAIN